MKIGHLEVTWQAPKALESRIKDHMMRLVDEDQEVRHLIARVSRGVAKDYIQDRAEQDSDAAGSTAPAGTAVSLPTD